MRILVTLITLFLTPLPVAAQEPSDEEGMDGEGLDEEGMEDFMSWLGDH